MPPNEQQLLENFRNLPASQPQSLLTQLNPVYAQESSALDPAIAT